VLNNLEVGGAERLTLALLQHLDTERFRASLLCLQQPGFLAEQLPGRVDFYHNYSGNKFDPMVLPAMVRLITSQRVDLVVSVGNGGDRMFWSSLACLITGRRLVVWCHSQPTLRSPTFSRKNRILQRVPHTFVAVSAGQALALTQIRHIPPSRINLIENALPDAFEVPAQKPSAQQRTRFRRQLKLSAKAFLIATVANLRSVKGHDILIDAAAEVLNNNKNIYFLLIGVGPQRPEILQHIIQRGIDDKHILFLGQRLDVTDILRNCDLFVSSSYTESFGLAVLEAMSAGLPVISTDSAGPRCLIEHNRTGLLTPVGQPERLARAIVNLLNAPQRRNRLAEKAQQFAQQKRFYIDTMVQAFEDLFELLI
jgi:glycosyltransferase involved in cell wall biosynthesis